MTTFTKRTSGKLLAVFLAALMIMTSVSVSFSALAAGTGDVTGGNWTALINALKADGVKDAKISGTQNTVLVDRTGNVYLAAKAYLAVFRQAALINSSADQGKNGTSEANSDYRTSTKVRDQIKTQLKSRMGDADYAAYNVANIVNALGGNYSVSTEVKSGNSASNNTYSAVNVTVTVAGVASLMNVASLSSITGDSYNAAGYKITYKHVNHYYTTEAKENCNTVTTWHHYLANATPEESENASASVDISALRALETAVNNAQPIFALDRAAQIAQGESVIAPVYQNVVEKKAAAESAFNRTIVAHFFPTLADDLAALKISVTIAQYVRIIAELNEKLATDFSAFTKAQLVSLYNEIDTAYTSYCDIGDDEVYAYFESGDAPIVDRTAVEARKAEIQNAMEIAVLREDVKPVVDAAYARCENYDRTWMATAANAGELLSASVTELTGIQTSLTEQYAEANVKLVFGDDVFDKLAARLDELNTLLSEYNYVVTFNQYVSVYNTAFAPFSLDASENELYDILSARDGWYSNLRAFVAELRAFDADFAESVMNGLDAVMTAKIDGVYAALNAKVEAKINNAYDLYAGFVAQYGYTIDTSDQVSVANYNQLQTVFAQLDARHYDFLAATDNFDISAEAVEKYNAVKDALFAFMNYDATKGLSAYKFEKETMTDILRLVTVADVARNADYKVDAEKREEAYEKIKLLLESDLVKGLLGDSFDLSSLGDTVKDFIFSDSLVNTLISLVYPIVIDNFAPVWATQLPETYQITQSGATFNFTIKPNLCSLRSALEKLGLYALPNQLASRSILNDYPEIKAKLAAVTYDPVYDAAQEKVTVNPWNDPSLVDEDGKLALEWGVHDKESFIDALTAGLAGVEPIILALLANKTTSKQVDIREKTIKASGKAYSIITVNVTLENIWLNMSFEGNPGFNNALAPILNALGAEDLPDGNVGTLYDLATCVADGFDQVINKLSGDPLDFILQALPNLAFALNYGLIMPLLGELKENIKYSASAYYTTDCSQAPPDTVSAVDETTIEINLGSMLDLEGMGIDLTSASGLVNSLVGLIGGSEEEETDPETGEPIPADPEAGEGEEESGFDIAALLSLIDVDELFSKLAYAGSDVTWNKGYRTVSPFALEGKESYMPYIESVPADLFLYVVRYLLDEIGANDELLPQLIEMFAKSEDGEPAELPELVQTIIDNVVAKQDESIAAVTELLVPQRYEMPAGIDWITEGNIGATDYAEYWTEGNEELTKTHWTREKALYMSEHLETIINYVIAALRDNIGGARTMNEALDYFIGTLFTAETANNLAATLKDTFGGLELPALLNDLDLFGKLGIDLTAWDEMAFDFEDGDKAAFKNALIEILDPLAPVLRFLLAEQDISLGDIPVTALGYDGYSYGLVPLLEALGCRDLKTTEEFIADPDNIVKNLIDPVFSLLDKIIADPMAYIDEVIPSLIYFEKVGGLQVSFSHLLFAVNVLLDTIRPIYDVDLGALLGDGINLDELAADPLKFLLSMLSDLASEKAGINLTFDFSLETLADSVHFTDPIKFTSANGDDAYTIKLSGDGKAELLVRILDYVIKQVIFEDNYDLIAGLIADNIEDEGVRDIIDQILGNVVKNYPESILSVVHLLFPERVEMTAPKIKWITSGNIGAKDDWMGTSKNEIPKGETSLWTKEKAEYMAEHLGDFADDVVVIFGEQLGGAEDLGAAVDFLVKDLLTPENAEKIAQGIKNFLTNLNLPDVLIDLGIFEQLGIDLHAWDNMTFNFKAGDKAAFKKALIKTLKPLEPLLRFLLVEGGDLEFTLLDAIPLRAMGYDGYSYGIVPLLEALGCTGIKTTKQFKADKDHVVENIVNPLFTAVDHLTDDPLAFIEDVIPSLVYFDKVEGIQVAIANLLFSANVILDTIKPIYELDLYDLIGEKAGVDLRFAETDPVDFLLSKVVELIKSKTDIELKIDFTVESLSETLHFTKPQKFTSKNGDAAYTIKLTEQGKADLLSRVLDYAVEQVIFSDNSDSLSALVSKLFSDDDTRALVLSIIQVLKESEKDMEDLHGIHDVALAGLFWIFFGADSATDAVSDFFYRYKDSTFYEIAILAAAKSPDYLNRVTFAFEEVYNVEYPAAVELAKEAPSYIINPLRYNDHQVTVISNIIHRMLVILQMLINFFRSR